MSLKSILTAPSSWFRAHRYEEIAHQGPRLNDEGLIATSLDTEDDLEGTRSACAPSEPILVNTVTSLDRREPLERLQEGFNKLVDQLQQINDHLNRQLEQHEDLMGRVRELPQALESLPSAVENQRVLTSQLLNQLRSTASKDQEFITVVGQIPVETARQTETLTDISRHLEASAETDVQLAESFNKFRGALDRLNHNTASNTEGIMQMSKTFAASDRYVKYVVSKLNRRFAWMLVGTVTVCVGVIAALVGFIFYLTR
jgi:chromosome segregation ATPase